MRYVWDENKNRRNRAKHGISFETAAQAFDDPFAITLRDRIVEDEERWRTLGSVANCIILLVVHLYRDDQDEECIRIISARKATPTERNAYEKNVKENT